MIATAYSTMGVEVVGNSSGEKLIDLRSDTVTRPSIGMYDAMMSASVGDDVYGDDESVNALQHRAAELLGKEAGLFLSSGTQSNLVALLTHCARGEEAIVGDKYHIFTSEACGASVLGGIALYPLTTDNNGGLTTEQVCAAVKEDDPHSPISRLLCLENTVHGRVQSPDNIQALSDAGRSAGLSVHIDGARLMNAVVALGVETKELAGAFDTVSLCLSKGLGAPVGSVLCGPKDFIRRARRNRKLLGGGMRQAGILAAGGSYALAHNVDRLAEDHANAKLLAEALALIPGLKVDTQTNMVFVRLPKNNAAELQASLAAQGIVISAGFPQIRIVTHLDVSTADIERVIDAFTRFFKG
ncbi:MAG: low-specificity L-threonine aldolase [Gammaproteobacteria bacterium]|nr:low-specificity L-threonine aldolase [Gammaproteobacteria bacterium]